MNHRLTANNQIIRDAMSRYSMYQYQVAEILGLNEGTVCRMMRKEIPEEEQRRIVSMIEEHVSKDQA